MAKRTDAGAATSRTIRTDGFRLGDKWIKLPVAGVFELNDDGKIKLWRDYFDLEDFNRQMAELMS